MGHLNGILARVGGNLNNNFQKSQMPGGLPRGGRGRGMLKLQFDRYITTKSVALMKSFDKDEISARVIFFRFFFVVYNLVYTKKVDIVYCQSDLLLKLGISSAIHLQANYKTRTSYVQNGFSVR